MAALPASLVFSSSGQAMKKWGKCPVDYGYQYSYNFGKESKARVTIEKIKELAPTVKDAILENVRARVGPTFVKRLQFDYGYAFDFDLAGDLRTNDTTRIDGYDLVFHFSDKGHGLSAFRFTVVTDGSGKLIDDLALPNIASDPMKAQIISCNQAREIAVRNGFPLDRSSIYFVYDWDSGSFTWMLYDNRAVEPDQPLFVGKGTYRKVLIEAHTGKVLKIYKETIIV